MSLKDIAKMTGVSVSTVSKVLNNSSATCASKEVREKIWKAAHETGYVPNAYARGLKQGSVPEKETVKVAIVLARIDSLEKDYFFKELYRYLEIALFESAAVLEKVLPASEVPKTDLSVCEGIIVLGRCPERVLAHLKKHSSNLVGIWRNPRDFDIDEIVCDGRKAAETAVLYLKKLGHEKIGYIGDCSYESRYVGYSETMIREKLPINYDLIIATDQTKEEGKKAMERLLLREDITAVLCANDMSAIGALEAMRAQGRKKKRISVISIDDIEEAQNTTPLLTTIHIPRQDMASMAVKILLDRIRHGHTEHLRIEFPCRITQRESCIPIKDVQNGRK